jgi:hypothetical protein
MVNKKILVKDGLKRVFQTTCGLSLLLAAYIFSGCASWPTEGPSGTFTITSIPAEYEGKFIKSSLYLPPEKGKLIPLPKEVARGPATAITNGELKLPLYGKEAGYFASDTANVCLRIGDTAAEVGGRYGNTGFDFIFAEVQFEDGMKELKWDDQVAPGFVTVTGIPPEFIENMQGSMVYIGNPDYELKVTLLGKSPVAQGAEATCSVAFPPPRSSAPRDIATGRFFASENDKYRSFPQSGTRDIVVQLATSTPNPNPNGVSMLSYSLFQFKAAPIQDGKIILDFSKGIRQ